MGEPGRAQRPAQRALLRLGVAQAALRGLRGQDVDAARHAQGEARDRDADLRPQLHARRPQQVRGQLAHHRRRHRGGVHEGGGLSR